MSWLFDVICFVQERTSWNCITDARCADPTAAECAGNGTAGWPGKATITCIPVNKGAVASERDSHLLVRHCCQARHDHLILRSLKLSHHGILTIKGHACGGDREGTRSTVGKQAEPSRAESSICRMRLYVATSSRGWQGQVLHCHTSTQGHQSLDTARSGAGPHIEHSVGAPYRDGGHVVCARGGLLHQPQGFRVYEYLRPRRRGSNGIALGAGSTGLYLTTPSAQVQMLAV